MAPQIPDRVVKILADNKDLIADNDYNKLFSKIIDAKDIHEVVVIFNSIGIDPLNYMTYVPEFYYSGSRYFPQKRIAIPEGIKTVDRFAFFNNNNVEEIQLPDGLRFIAQESFARCGSLTKINFPHSLEAIGEFAFQDCDSLLNIIYAGTTEEFLDIQGADKLDKPNRIFHCIDGDLKYDYSIDVNTWVKIQFPLKIS